MAESWIIPCNIKHFDIVKHFKVSEVAVWRNSFSIRSGDTVYIYLSAPYSEIRYRCKVINDEVSDELLAEHMYAITDKPSNNYYSKRIKYIVIKFEYEYPEKALTLSELRKHGLGQVQIQARADRKLQYYISEVDRCVGDDK